MKKAGAKNIASVARALQVLEAFRAGDRSLTLAELSNRTKLYKSTILRLIQTLESFGYLERIESGEYRIGQSTLRLANLYQNAVQPADIILPVLRALVAETRESASYYVRRGDVRVCVYRVDSPLLLRDHSQAGHVIPLGRGSAGAIFLAFETPYKAQYAPIRKRMAAMTHGEIEAGMTGMAAPVLGPGGPIAGVLALTGAESRFDRASARHMESVLVEAARGLTVTLGGPPDFFDRRIDAARRVPR